MSGPFIELSPIAQAIDALEASKAVHTVAAAYSGMGKPVEGHK